jgi:hypothetical protein
MFMQKAILSTIAFLAALAISPQVEANSNGKVLSESEVVSMFWRDAGGAPLTPDSPEDTPVYDARFHNAATAPDGHQLTVGELTTVTASATAKCVGPGTQIKIDAEGLVPNGVYTVWLLIFNGPFPAGPGPIGPFPFGNLAGLGPLGQHDGSQNSFQADENGEGHLNVVVHPGLLYAEPPPPFLAGVQYPINGCLDELEFHLVAVYHFDSMTYGSGPGYNHGAVEQFGFRFIPDDL